MRIRHLALVLASALLAACDGGGGGGSTGPTAPPASVLIVAGNNQNAAVNTLLPQELLVQVLDAAGAPVRNATVLWQLTHGGGTLTPITTLTDEKGEARASYKLGTTVGSETITAVVGTLSVAFQENAGHGPVATATVTPARDTLVAGGTVRLGVTAADAFGNAVPIAAVQWSSSNNGVATVGSDGRATAVALGTATITATLENGVAGTSQVVVVPEHAPTVFTRPFQPGNASTGSANVNGDVNPNGLSTTTWVEWGTDPTLATSQQLPASPRQVPTLNQPFALEVVLTPISAGVTYYYRIAAQNAQGTVRGNIQSFTIPVASATNVHATMPADSLLVRLSFQVDANTQSFYVERRTVPDAYWQRISYVNTTAGKTSLQFTDFGFPLDADTSFAYRVQACSYGHACFPSAEVQVSISTLRGPTNLTLSVDAAHHVVLTWQDNDTRETGYLVYRYAGSSAVGRPVVAQLPPNSTSYVDATALQGTTYEYQVWPFVTYTNYDVFTGESGNTRQGQPAVVFGGP